MSDRFVILTAPRSGSNMLVGLLEQHPEVRCFGELMRRTPGWFARGERVPRPESVLHVLHAVDAKYRDDAYRFAHAEAFVEAAYATRPGGAVYGFKLHLHQEPEFADRLIADPRVRLILLRRENVLAQYSSEKIAKLTGQGAARHGDDVKRATAAFDRDDFERYVAQWEGLWDRLESRLKASGRSHVAVRYAELVAGGGIDRVLGHLGLEGGASADPVTLRRNPPAIAERFDDPEAVREALAACGRGAWAFEGEMA